MEYDTLCSSINNSNGYNALYDNFFFNENFDNTLLFLLNDNFGNTNFLLDSEPLPFNSNVNNVNDINDDNNIQHFEPLNDDIFDFELPNDSLNY